MTTFPSLHWDPVREIASMLAGMDRLVDRARSTAGSTPPVNVYAGDDAAAVTIELPGVPADAVQIHLHGDALTIAASTPQEQADGWLVRERAPIDFRRSVQLPFPVDPEQVTARMTDGVLSVTLHRAAQDRPRRIAIAAA